MVDKNIDFSHLSVSARLELIGEIWDSLEELPESPELLAELERRSVDAARDPSAGRTWEEVKADLKTRLQ